jgi:hypothetical protein
MGTDVCFCLRKAGNNFILKNEPQPFFDGQILQ